jgi:uncharacterized protein DUF4232
MKLHPIAAAGLALVISGCTLHIGSGQSAGQPGSARPGTGSQAAGQGGVSGAGSGSGAAIASAAPVTVTSPAAPPPGPPPIGRCHTSMLRLHVGTFGAGAGQRYAVLTLINISGVSCQMYGYAGMQLAFTHGGEVPTNVVRTDPALERLFTLAPGHQAWTRLHWTVVPATDEASPNCQPIADYLWVTPPDETSQLGKGWLGGLVCQHGEIDILPMQPGVPGPA